MITRRRWLGLVPSGVLHLGLVAMLVLASTDPAGLSGRSRRRSPGQRWFGVTQLRGPRLPKTPGFDPLFHILSAPDGMMVRLTSPTDEATVGLGWLSPS